MFTLALHGLEASMNSYLRMDPDTIARLAKLNGKIIKMEIEDWRISFYILPTTHGVELQHDYSGEADTCISGKLDAMFKLSCAKGSSESLFKNRIAVSGNTQTGEAVREILAKIDIDWEEQLSKLTGDIIAHKVGNVFRTIKNASQKTRQTIGLNIKEYLQHESGALVTPEEITGFCNQVSAVRNDVERAEARLNRLIKKGN